MRTLYKITNLVNGKCYIGQTKNFKRRIQGHRNGDDPNSPIHLAIKKYGKQNFSYEAIGDFEDDLIDYAERSAIVLFNSLKPNGYNLESGGCLNKTASEETKRKISEVRKAQKLSPPNKGKPSPFRGVKRSPETIAKMSLAQKGKPRPKRGPMSEETKRKIGEANKGRKPPIASEETRLKISRALKGRKQSPEHTRKCAEARRGKPSKRKGCHLTEETKIKISIANQGRKRPDVIIRNKLRSWINK